MSFCKPSSRSSISNIIGTIHNCPMSLGHSHHAVSNSVMEDVVVTSRLQSSHFLQLQPERDQHHRTAGSVKQGALTILAVYMVVVDIVVRLRSWRLEPAMWHESWLRSLCSELELYCFRPRMPSSADLLVNDHIDEQPETSSIGAKPPKLVPENAQSSA